MDLKFEVVTPEIAREWLDRTRINRPLRADQVDAHVRDMKGGRWRPVGDPVRFDKDERLIDGQHRLTAIVKSGVDITFAVVRGLEPDDQLVIDTGVKRRAADQLILEGKTGKSYSVRVTSVARQLFAIDQGRPYDGRLRVTNTEIFDTMQRYPLILDSVVAVEGLNRVAGISPLNAGVAHALGSIKIPTTTWEFFEQLKSGVGFTATSPGLLLRNRLTSGFDAPTRMAQLFLVLRCLILEKDDVQTYTRLQLPKDSKVQADDIIKMVNQLLAYRDERETKA